MPRPDVRDERIPQILDAAARIFAQHGVDGSSMNQVAAESGLSKATIYHYFRSKTDMVEALLGRLFEPDLAKVEKLKSAEGTSLERMTGYVEELGALLEANSRLFPIVAEFKATASRTESAQQVLKDYFERYIEVFGELLRQGKERGELSSEVDPEIHALTLVALIEGCILLSQNTGRPLPSLLNHSVPAYLVGLQL